MSKLDFLEMVAQLSGELEDVEPQMPDVLEPKLEELFKTFFAASVVMRSSTRDELPTELLHFCTAAVWAHKQISKSVDDILNTLQEFAPSINMIGVPVDEDVFDKVKDLLDNAKNAEEAMGIVEKYAVSDDKPTSH